MPYSSRISISCLLFFICFLAIAFEDVEEMRGINLVDDKLMVKDILDGFCQLAILTDRGLSHYNTDEWIYDYYCSRESFHQALSESKPTDQYLIKDVPAVYDKKNPGVFHMHNTTRYSRKLRTSLREYAPKLPGVYLRAEGLMALVRPEFAGLFESKNKRRQIADLVHKTYDDNIRHLHAVMFAVPDNYKPIVHARLRMISLELDREIVKLLSQTEQERLATLISDSVSLNYLVKGPSFL